MVNKQKILIVDDDEAIAELVSLYLAKECFDTMMVHDGEKALVAFDTYHPNLVLLDLMLPGIDGYQVCREIRARANTRENTRADARSGTVLRKKYAPPPEAQCGGSSDYPPVPPPSSRRASGKASNPTGRPYTPLHAFPQSSHSPSPPPPGKLRRNPETPSSPAIPPA